MQGGVRREPSWGVDRCPILGGKSSTLVMGGNPGQMVAAAERWESRTKLKSTGWFASPTQQSRGSGETLKPEDYESLGLFHDR
jgi:hypothetical protein